MEQFYLGLPPHQLSFQMVPAFPFHALPMQSAASGLSFIELRLALRMHPDKAHQNGMCQMLCVYVLAQWACGLSPFWNQPPTGNLHQFAGIPLGPEEATKRFQQIQEAYSVSHSDTE